MWEQAELRTLKLNRYILIDDEPCKITSIQISKPGKHGEAKCRVEAASIFTGQKKSFVHPVTHKVKVPMINKRTAQVLSLTETEVQLMDLETYETFNVPIPDEFKDELEAGKEVHFLIAMERKKITRVV